MRVLELLEAERTSVGPAQAALLGRVGSIPHCSSLNPRCEQRAARSHVYYRQSHYVKLWRDILLQRLSWGENVTRVCQEEFVVMVD